MNTIKCAPVKLKYLNKERQVQTRIFVLRFVGSCLDT